ncbi:hypothetical protein [Mediterraneibacter faecis]|uniref:hypothetical protein n=1 Tax=Mediterraneibacter faecis TaxID=592978 RepID=UPI003F9E2F63
MKMMKNKHIFLKYYIKSKYQGRKVSSDNIRTYIKEHIMIANEKIQTAEEINIYIRNLILSGKPFLAGRFGATELSCVRTFDFEVSSKYDKVLSQMKMWSGFFPSEKEMGFNFKNLMMKSIPSADVMGIWMLPFEEYYLNKYGKTDLKTTYLFDLEPWSSPENPWSAALKGKKVLVIHPFAETIKFQYQNRVNLFPGTEILPEFELKILKAVQTVAGTKDDRFDSWFDALEWMYQEAIKIDFDVAIIGCGAYGFPLAAKLKQVGKQAIHLGGATQLLFGIKGKRWDEKTGTYEYVQKFFNDAWVYPSDEDKPKAANKVEGGCYW